MIPFDRMKPLIAIRMVNANDPIVKATVSSLPSAAMNRNKAVAIWLTSTRRRNCLKNLHKVETYKHVIIHSIEMGNGEELVHTINLLSMF